jgi:hypothetical protein
MAGADLLSDCLIRHQNASGVSGRAFGAEYHSCDLSIPKGLACVRRNIHFSEAEVNNICHLLDLTRTRALAAQPA